MTDSVSSESDFPIKPITLLVAFPPNGPADIAAKGLQKVITKYLKIPIIIKHLPGNGGVTATTEVINGKPDGYTLCFSAAGALVIQPRLQKLSYSTPNSYTPIINIVNNPVCFAVRKKLNLKTIDDFITYATHKEMDCKIASQDEFSIPHLVVEQFSRLAQINIHHVHYPSGIDSLRALLKGEVDAISNHPSIVFSEYQQNNIEILGVFEKKRNCLFPEVPTFCESDFKITLGGYLPIIGPPEIPLSRISIIHNAFKEALVDNEFIKLMKERGVTIFYQNSQELRDRLITDYFSAGNALEVFSS